MTYQELQARAYTRFGIRFPPENPQGRGVAAEDFRAIEGFRPHCPTQTGTLNLRSAKVLGQYPRQESNL